MSAVSKSFCYPNSDKHLIKDATFIKEYGFNSTACRNMRQGKSMNYLIQMNFVRIDLFKLPTQEDRFNRIIDLLDVQREQDLDRFGSDGSPFEKSLKETLEDIVLKRAAFLLEFRDREELIEEMKRRGILK